MESRGEEWGSQVGKGPSVPASPPRTPHPHGGKHPGFPVPKTAVTVCVEGAAAGTREQVLRHCCSPGLRAKWTQNSRAGCQGPAAHMDAATQSLTEARVTGHQHGWGSLQARLAQWVPARGSRVVGAAPPSLWGGVIGTPSTNPSCCASVSSFYFTAQLLCASWS